MKARRNRPVKCPMCKRIIRGGQTYERVVRFARANEMPNLYGGRVTEEVHTSPCLPTWEESLRSK